VFQGRNHFLGHNLDEAEAQEQLHGGGGITVKMQSKKLVISSEFEWC
jgi:hypothetical protein